MNFIEKIKNAGVVGAGGAGFPTHVKMGTTVEWLLVNAAECEPLMHKDKELMQHYADTIVQGIKLAAEHTKAQKIVIGIKSKNTKAIASLNTAIKKPTRQPLFMNLQIIIRLATNTKSLLESRENSFHQLEFHWILVLS